MVLNLLIWVSWCQDSNLAEKIPKDRRLGKKISSKTQPCIQCGRFSISGSHYDPNHNPNKWWKRNDETDWNRHDLLKSTGDISPFLTVFHQFMVDPLLRRMPSWLRRNCRGVGFRAQDDQKWMGRPGILILFLFNIFIYQNHISIFGHICIFIYLYRIYIFISSYINRYWTFWTMILTIANHCYWDWDGCSDAPNNSGNQCQTARNSFWLLSEVLEVSKTSHNLPPELPLSWVWFHSLIRTCIDLKYIRVFIHIHHIYIYIQTHITEYQIICSSYYIHRSTCS